MGISKIAKKKYNESMADQFLYNNTGNRVKSFLGRPVFIIAVLVITALIVVVTVWYVHREVPPPESPMYSSTQEKMRVLDEAAKNAGPRLTSEEKAATLAGAEDTAGLSTEEKMRILETQNTP